MPILESGEETTLVGGQAVMEGVMMRAPHSYCVAVRKADGEIVTEQMPLPRMADKYKIFKYPVFRGVGTLAQAMSLGMKALKFSADVSLGEEQEKPDKKPMDVPDWVVWINVAFSLAFFIFTSKYLPLYFTSKLKDVYPALGSGILFNLAEGLIRTSILVLLMYGLSLMKDMRRVFEFHGAEHKVVFNFESGQPVTVENAQKFSTFHPRCGTSFLFVIIIVSVAFYTFIPYQDFLRRFLCRIALLPLIAGVSYELIRFAAKRRGSVLSTLTAPGLWLQRITTKPPSDVQTAVAIRALEGAMALEAQQGGQLVIA
jgi:uncharacterized protein YqhQ